MIKKLGFSTTEHMRRESGETRLSANVSRLNQSQIAIRKHSKFDRHWLYFKVLIISKSKINDYSRNYILMRNGKFIFYLKRHKRLSARPVF